LHLGNYLGSIHDCLDLQYEYVGGAFYFIADLHEMTSSTPGPALRERTIGSAIDYLALGLQPDMVTFFVQSDVPQVTELMWMLSCVTPAAWLAGASGFATSDLSTASAGLFIYPALMAADCLALRATDLPIGADQIANVSILRDIAVRWNRHYRTNVFPVPQPNLSLFPELPGTDGLRMSKSAGNTIPVFAEPDELESSVKRIDSDEVVLELLEAVTGIRHTTVGSAGLSGQEARARLAEAVAERFAEPRSRRREWLSQRRDVEDLLLEGGERARMEASETLEIVRGVIGLGPSST
jgi:tryptophanyl-tRNA synthetase